MLDVDTRELKKLESDLRTFASRAYPFAVRSTLNGAAFDNRGRVQATIREDLITRNKFTVNSIRVERAKSLNVRRMEAMTGSIAPYMDEQEFGGTKVKQGKHGVPLPTSVASGEGRSVRPRRRLPRKANKLGNLQLSKKAGRGFKSGKQKRFLKVLQAAKTGKKHVFLEKNGRQALYGIKGRLRKGRRDLKGLKLDMIYDLSRQTVSIPATPIFGPTAKETQRIMPALYVRQLKLQLDRRGLLKGGR